ncbi:hypothetical protein BKA61DRAFT_35365 [Leptodontidium sp. MPI-SDFR-AT-0119]|nr:hypothetical protein BKA61DRAFT_35365 [Leptodontidium sp. MPI-SDFR-AT-0119]
MGWQGDMTDKPARSLACFPCGETTVLATAPYRPLLPTHTGRRRSHLGNTNTIPYPIPFSFFLLSSSSIFTPFEFQSNVLYPVSPSTSYFHLLLASSYLCRRTTLILTLLHTELLKVYPLPTHTTAIMQFTIVALLSLVAVAFAGPIAMPQRLDG